MLVLSRKKNETIVIGSNIKIQVLKVSGSTVRLGITAPRDVKVIRGELAPYEIDVDDAEDKKTDLPGSDDVSRDQDGHGLRLVAEFDVQLDESAEMDLRIANPFAPVM